MAKGSHATFDGYPNRCHYGDQCLHGGRILITGPHSLRFETNVQTGEMVSYHVDCWRHHNHIRPCG